MSLIEINKNQYILNKPGTLSPEDIQLLTQTDKLYVGSSYLGPLDILPPNITGLSIHYDGPPRVIDNISPHVKFIRNEVNNVDFVNLPPGLEIFYCVTNCTQNTVNSLPHGLKEIRLNYFLGDNFTLPDSVEKIHFNNRISSRENFSHKINFPSNLKDLILPSNYNYPLDNLPDGIKNVIVGDSYNFPLDNLPSTIECLQLKNSNFSYPLDNLPSSLKYLIIDEGRFSYPLDNLPNSIRVLKIPLSPKHSYNNLPDQIETLEISFFQHQHKIVKIPSKLKNLSIHSISQTYETDILDSFSHIESISYLSLDGVVNVNSLPPNIKFLKINRLYELNVDLSSYHNLEFVQIRSDKNFYHLIEQYPNINFVFSELS